MNLYARETFAEFSWEYNFDKIYMLLADSHWIPDMDPTLLQDYILISFPTRLRNIAATYTFWLRQAMEASSDPGYLATEDHWEGRCEPMTTPDSLGMTSIHSLNNRATEDHWEGRCEPATTPNLLGWQASIASTTEPQMMSPRCLTNNNGPNNSDGSCTDLVDLVESVQPTG
jgi:hypothetical protein